ncbi:hypothetical protein ACFWPX_29970 [Nocardia sp. NPDC058518]|uniref:hypothetical protein n=1 Tax=Nocardia sp. NPDC058518 TaxID=3346534 RepID=UPI0036649D75
MDAVVTHRLLARTIGCLIAAFALLMMASTVAIAQSPSTPPTTTAPSSPTTTAEPDLYEPCREIGETVPGLGEVLELGCDVTQAATNPGEAASEAGKGFLEKIAASFAKGWTNAITMMFSWWYRTPITGSTNTDGTSDTVEQVHSYLGFLQVLMFVVCMGLALVKIAWASAQQRALHVQQTNTYVVRTVVAASLAASFVIGADSAMRGFSVWLLSKLAATDDPAAAVERLINVAAMGNGLGAALLLTFAQLGMLGCIAQMVFIMVQLAVSKLALGTLPLAAAASGTEPGMQTYRKLMAWVVVFVLFPPATALIYGLALSMSLGAEDAQGTLAGLVLLTLSCFALPALVRLIVPMAAQAAGGNSAGMLAGAGALATGAVPIMSSTLRGGGQPPGGGAGAPPGGGGRSDGDGPSGAVSVVGGGGGPTGGGARGASGAPGAARTTAGGLSGGAMAGAGPVGMAVGAAGQQLGSTAGQLAGGARQAIGDSTSPPPPSASGSIPPSGGRSDNQ